jgi:hypothetical protein
MTASGTGVCIRDLRVRPECESDDCEWDRSVYQLTVSGMRVCVCVLA